MLNNEVKEINGASITLPKHNSTHSMSLATFNSALKEFRIQLLLKYSNERVLIPLLRDKNIDKYDEVVLKILEKIETSYPDLEGITFCSYLGEVEFATTKLLTRPGVESPHWSDARVWRTTRTNFINLENCKDHYSSLKM